MKRVIEIFFAAPMAGVEKPHRRTNNGLMLHPSHTSFCLSALPYCLTSFHHSEKSQAHMQPGVCTDNSVRLNKQTSKKKEKKRLRARFWFLRPLSQIDQADRQVET